MPVSPVFPQGVPVYIHPYNGLEVAYYQRNGKAYKRSRCKGVESWADTTEYQIPRCEFDAIIAERELVKAIRDKYLADCESLDRVPKEWAPYLPRPRREVKLWVSLTGYVTRLVKSVVL